MTEGQGLRAAAVRLAGFAAVIALLAMPASAAAMAGPPSGLSPRLAELAKPSVRSAPPATQAAALSVAPRGPGSLLREGNRVVVDVRFDRGAATGADDLRAAGAKILHVSRRYQTVTVAVKPADLHTVGAVPGVGGVIEVLAPVVSSTECRGLVTSEGDSQLAASAARSAFGVDGSGVKVGILSDSFDTAASAADGSGPVATHAPEDIASGDLPGPGNPCGHTTPVNIFEDYAPSSLEEPEPADEGRAMAQIVHDLAPGASLAFATAFNGELSFADNIRALRAVGADAIVDDVFYLDEPFFQDGPVAVAVNEVTADGAAYFSAAGNDNAINNAGHDIASWEAPAFREPGSCPPGVPAYAKQCMDFDPTGGVNRGFQITVEPKATLTVDLQWAQPWNGVTTDLDAYLLKGGVLEAESEFPNADPSFQEPVEIFSWTNPESKSVKVELAINRCEEPVCGAARAAAHPTELGGTTGGDAGTPPLKFELLNGEGEISETQYPVSSGGDTVGPTIFGHSGAEGAVSVGAVRYNTTTKPESFSSRGPVTHYFGPVSGIAPAAKLTPPQTISKPDLAATDCGATTFFAQLVGGVWRFCGTSAAAPHAAAVAALMRQANPSLSNSQLRTALAATASPVGAFGINAVGAGLVNAYGAVSSVALPPQITITEPPLPLSKNASPHIGFAANRPVAFSCSLDGRAPQPCSSPFVPSAPLLDGVHGFAVTGVDAAGRTGGSGTVSFTVDTKPPRTILRHHPPKTIRTRHRRAKAVFRFGSNEAGAVFVCKVDGGLSRFCSRRYVRRFRLGKHTLRVQARDLAGNLDRTPVVFRFKVKQVD